MNTLREVLATVIIGSAIITSFNLVVNARSDFEVPAEHTNSPTSYTMSVTNEY